MVDTTGALLTVIIIVIGGFYAIIKASEYSMHMYKDYLNYLQNKGQSDKRIDKKICSKCNMQNNIHNQFCSYCGFRLKEE